MDYEAEKILKCPKCGKYTLEIIKTKSSGKLNLVCSHCKSEYIYSSKNADKENYKGISLISNNKKKNIIYMLSALFIIILTAFILFMLLNKSETKSELKKENIVAKTEQKEDINKDSTIKKKQIKEQNISSIVEKEPRVKHSSDKNKAIETTVPKSAIKIFDTSYIKVRSSHRNSEDPSFRWFYNRKTITLEREPGQRVFISGGPEGTEKWAVDNEIRINDKRITGTKKSPERIGMIPENIKVEPYEITDLIPPGKEIELDIRLTDYGILWGNTAVYVVVK